MENLIGKTIKTLKGIEIYEVGPDENQYFKVIDVDLEDEECYRIVLDVKSYETVNIPAMKANWYNSDGVACLKWIETSDYPKNGRETIYVSTDALGVAFDVVDPNTIPMPQPKTYSEAISFLNKDITPEELFSMIYGVSIEQIKEDRTK
jgi:hypothetical protein